MQSPPEILVGIFVGGRGSRMGGAKKGLLLTHGPGAPTILQRLLDTIPAALGSVSVVLVGDAEGYEAFQLPAVSDLPAGVGPLGGLHGALLHAQAVGASQLIALACDLPYLTPEVLVALAQHNPAAAAVAPEAAPGIFDPLVARYAAGPAQIATDAALAKGQHSLQVVLRSLNCEALALSEAERHSLRDWDRLEDRLEE